MEHGTEAYFAARERNVRRVSALSVAVGLVLLAPILALRLTPLGETVRSIPMMRFGLEGPPRFVELVQIDARLSAAVAPHAVGPVVVRAQRGEAGNAALRPSRRTATTPPRSLPGTGKAEGGRDLVARALTAEGSVPIFQSSELIIEELVRPEYPERARDRGVEGRVAVLALVDTLGHVAEAQVMSPSGEPELDRASWNAVLRCRFRPYRMDGRTQEVYAVFRFSFRIY